MTKEEKIINVAGLVYTLRDLLEEVDWNRELKQRTKNYAAYLDRLVREIAADRDVWQELDELQEHFYNNFVREKKNSYICTSCGLNHKQLKELTKAL